MTENVFDSLTDAELAQMTDRAYREAARCWREARAYTGTFPIARALRDSARSADDFYRQLADEMTARAQRAESTVTE